MTKKVTKEVMTEVSKILTNGEVLTLEKQFKDCDNVSGNSKFTYAIARTLDSIELIVKGINKTNVEPDEHKEYMESRKKLVLDVAKKEEDGKYSEANRFGSFSDVVVEDETKLIKKLKKLAGDNKKVIDARLAQQIRYKDYIDDLLDDDIKFHDVIDDNIPEDISVKQLYPASFLLKLKHTDCTDVKLKVKDILNVMSILNSVGDLKDDIVNDIIFNIRSIKDIRDNEVFTSPTYINFKKYRTDREVLLESLCGESYLGYPSISVIRDSIILYHYEDTDNAKAKSDKFEDEHKEIIKEYEGYIEEELTVQLRLIELDDVPDEITSAQMKLLIPMIKE